jgi:hypothetical protein
MTETRNQRDAREIAEQDKRFAAKRAAEQHRIERKQQQQANAANADEVTAKIETRAALIMDGVGEVLGEISARAHKDLEAKCAELRREFEAERIANRRELERQIAEARRERDILQNQIELLQATHQRELATVARQVATLQNANVLADVFGGQHDNVFDTLKANFDRFRSRTISAQIRRIA